MPEGAERTSGHVSLNHGQQYTVRLLNCGRRSDATVKIDGKEIGTFRLNPNQDVVLERAPDDNGRFTFYASGSYLAGAAGEGNIAVPDKGLIEVTFRPEKVRPRPEPTARVMHAKSLGGGVRGQSMGAMPDASEGCSFAGEEKTAGGITGLSGHSDQKFTTVGLMEYDPAGTVTITLRLVLAAEPRELKPQRAGNPVPEVV